jgi:hypothetical protein
VDVAAASEAFAVFLCGFFPAALFAATFLTVAFFRYGWCRLHRPAHRFFNAATIAALPALLSFRFGFDGSVVRTAVRT